MAKISRRLFIQCSSLGAVGAWWTRGRLAAQEPVTPAGTARSCILIKLLGGPSHVDTVDLREGAWPPPNFDVVNCGSIRLSRRLFPNLCPVAENLTVVRSFRAWGLEHGQAQYALMA